MFPLEGLKLVGFASVNVKPQFVEHQKSSSEGTNTVEDGWQGPPLVTHYYLVVNVHWLIIVIHHAEIVVEGVSS